MDIKKKNIIFLFNHYKNLIELNKDKFIIVKPSTDSEHLINLCNEAIYNYDEFYSLDNDNSKVNRWLGFIQGILIANDITSVIEERNFTRSYLTEHRSVV